MVLSASELARKNKRMVKGILNEQGVTKYPRKKNHKQHINEKRMAANLKMVSEGVENESKLRSEIQQFSFQCHCFFCGEEISPDIKAKGMHKGTTRLNIMYTVCPLAVLEKLKLLKLLKIMVRSGARHSPRARLCE